MVSAADISKNVVRQMYFLEGNGANANNLPPPLERPILQVINVKHLPPAGGNDPSKKARTRVVISDGTHYFQSMMASQVQNTNQNDDLKENCIIQLNRYMVNKVSQRTVVILLDIAILGQLPTRIGDPVDVESAVVQQSGGTTAQPNTVTPASGPENNQRLYNNTTQQQQQQPPAAKRPKPNQDNNNNNPYGGGGGGIHPSPNNNPYGRPSRSPGGGGQQAAPPIIRSTATAANGQPITTIAALNMYNNRWTIRARITSKSDIKTWSNSKGEGSLFSVELLDESMDIRATFFKEAVDKFYNFLEVGKVYTLSGGRLKVANMQYNTCKSNFEITFDQNSEIHLCDDDGQIQKQQYEFIKIADMENVDAGKNVDVLAIVKDVGEPVSLISKKSGQELHKCDLTLLDDSGAEIILTLWGDKAQTARTTDFPTIPVVAAFRRTRIGDYNGKSLSGASSIDVNPTADLVEAQNLWSWYQQSGSTVTARSLSSTTGGGRQDNFTDRKSIASIKQENMGMLGDNKADWLSFKGTLSFIKKDREGGAWYPACANTGEPCKNRFKVTQTTDGQWYCAKCENTYPNPVRRWIFSGVVEDPTSSTWVSFFNEQAETLLGGLTADACYEQAYGNGGFDQDIYDSAFAKALFSEWIFKCKVKQEVHNDESRVKTSVYSLHPVDYVKESKDLLAEIEKF